MPQWWYWLHTRSGPVLGMGEEATGFICARVWMSVLFSDLRKWIMCFITENKVNIQKIPKFLFSSHSCGGWTPAWALHSLEWAITPPLDHILKWTKHLMKNLSKVHFFRILKRKRLYMVFLTLNGKLRTNAWGIWNTLSALSTLSFAVVVNPWGGWQLLPPVFLITWC